MHVDAYWIYLSAATHLAYFRRYIIRRSYGSLSAVAGVLEHPSNSEVTDFDLVFAREKNILGFKISMQNLSIVNIFRCQSDLHKPIEYLTLAGPF